MPQKNTRKLKKQLIHQKAIEKVKRRKIKRLKNNKKNINKLVIKIREQNLILQLQEQQQPTFNRMSSTNTPTNNISHGSVRSAVLNHKVQNTSRKLSQSKILTGFNKAAWTSNANTTNK